MADDSGRNSPSTSDSTQNDDAEVDDDAAVMPLSRSKKRVQFHSDENLVKIREIPPRGEQQTTDEEDSGCSDDDDDTWPPSDTDKGGGNIPVIVDNAVKLDSVAKGSYDVSKTKGKGSHIVAQITGVSVSNQCKTKQKRNSSRDRKPKKLYKVSGEKLDCAKSKHKTGKKKSQKKTESEKLPSPSRKCKDIKGSKPNVQNNTKPAPSKPPVRCLLPLRKIPTKQDLQPSLLTSLPNGFDNHIRSTNTALQNMSVGKVYTVDGFIFPSDPSDQIKAKSVNDSEPEVSKSELSKTVQQRKKCFAWHMANGDQQNLLFGTPCILPLWESVQSYSGGPKPGPTCTKRT